MRTNTLPCVTDQLTELNRQRFQVISNWIFTTADEFVDSMFDRIDRALDGGIWSLNLLDFIQHRSDEVGWSLEELFGQIEDLHDQPVENLKALVERIADRITDKYRSAGINKTFYPTVTSTHRCGNPCTNLSCYTVHIQSTDYRG